jgi:Uma2 family endonuclease
MARGRTCRPFTSDTAIRIPAGTIRYPDLGVDCVRPGDREMAAAEPALIVEVLSPSTSPFDRTTKLEEYKTVPSARYILLIDPDRPRTLLYARDADGAWDSRIEKGEDKIVALPSLDVALAHADLYDGLTLRARLIVME